MLTLIKELFSPKVKARIVIRAALSREGILRLQELVSFYSVLGWMNAVPFSHVLLELEGPRARIEKVIQRMRIAPFMAGGKVMEVTWMPYQGNFHSFRMAA